MVEGLKGWLFIPIAGLILGIFTIAYEVLSTYLNYELNFFAIAIIILGIINLLFNIFCLWSIFKKKKYVPKLMIAFYIVNMVSYLINWYIGIEDLTGLITIVVIDIIWIMYFLESERVKNTFIK